MNPELGILTLTAMAIGFTHTLIGVDHSLPFIVIGRAQGWPLRRVMGLTLLCGLGHVLSSVLLGAIGIGLGVAVRRLEWVESARGSWAAWSLIGFGAVYAAWAFGRERRRQQFAHEHADGTLHAHASSPGIGHRHARAEPGALTAWSLFIVFVLGPCEPLIPLLLVPALQQGIASAAWIAFAFGAVTIGTMMGIVLLGYWGLGAPAFRRFEPYANTMAGLAIALSGLAIRIFGI